MKGEWFMQKAVIQLETLSCPSCMQKIENAVKRLNGIHQDSVKILFNASKVRLDFDSETVAVTDIEKAIEDLGYGVLHSKVKSA
jgi:copper chaperone